MPTTISVPPTTRWMMKTEKIGSIKPQPASKKKSEMIKYFTSRPILILMFTLIRMSLLYAKAAEPVDPAMFELASPLVNGVVLPHKLWARVRRPDHHSKNTIKTI